MAFSGKLPKLKHHMKYTLIISLALFTACANKPNAEKLLQIADTRDSIMQAICNNHTMAAEMINYLTNSSASADLMKGTSNYMKTSKANELIKKDTGMQNMMVSNILSLINSDSMTCDKTCTQISRIPQFNRIMQRKMKAPKE
jgi:hypothetical protein